MPKSNSRFVVIWAALVPVLTGACLLVAPLHVAAWSQVQTGLAVAEINAASAVVLALYAYLWAHSVKEPAVIQGSVSALALSTVLLGDGFGWFSLDDAAAKLLVGFVGLLVVLVLTAFNRSVAYAPETVAILTARAQTPEAMHAAIAPKLHPPETVDVPPAE